MDARRGGRGVCEALRRGVLVAGIAALMCADVHAQTPDSGLGEAFTTRHAAFEPVPFEDIPGWESDSLQESAEGMRQSCNALRSRPAWSQVCAEFAAIDSRNDGALRDFFVRNFRAYSILSPARQPDGLITGYFEPLLEGRRQRDEEFRYPVYGLPNDLRLLDASVRDAGPRQWLRSEGIRLLPAPPGSAGATEYTLLLDDASPNIRDKRLRVRVDGDRIHPYWSRQDIEIRALDASVLAWVSAPARLYSMQVQGSGKIRFEDGSLIRLSYVEQNGHPFLPNITRGTDTATVLSAIKTRGLSSGGATGAGIADADPSVPQPVNDEVARLIAMFQGQASTSTSPPRPAGTAPAAPARSDPAPAHPVQRPVDGGGARRNPDVDAMIAALGGGGSQAQPQAAARPATTQGNAAASPSRPASPPPPSVPAGGGPAGGGIAAITNIPDPSYVFFRSSAGDSPRGPVGALGVPLTAGRSLAVDPRSTPLGSPVFIATTAPAGGGPLRRLMFAQDTGGAIRGSVRGDLFWGFGDSAGRMALATNNPVRMWLLLPRTQQVNSGGSGAVALRSLGSRDALPECVIDDPELCVEG